MLPIILAIRDENDRNYVANVYEKYKGKLFIKAMRILNNEADACDCVEDVFRNLIENLQDYQTWDAKHQRCFLSVCCRNIAINQYNKNKRRLENEISTTEPDTRAEIDIEDVESDIKTILLREETSNFIVRCIEEMPSQNRDLLLSKYYLGMKNIEIAKMMDLPINTVNVRIMRAKANLKERLVEEGYGI